MHIRDHARAEGWFRKHAAAPSSVGSWKAFVARNNREQEPRNMADGGQIIGKPGGIVEPGIEYYGKKVVVGSAGSNANYEKAQNTFYDTYGKEAIDKASKEKHKVTFDKLKGDDKRRNFKAKFKREFETSGTFMSPEDSRKFSRRKRIKIEQGIQINLIEETNKPGKFNAGKFAEKHKLSMEEVKAQAKLLQKNIYKKRMLITGTTKDTKSTLEWIPVQDIKTDTTLEKLSKSGLTVYKDNRTDAKFYDAFGRKFKKGSTTELNSTYNLEKYKAIRQNKNEYDALRKIINKKYPNINFELDHPLSQKSINALMDGTPEELSRVNVLDKELNRNFKKQLSDKYLKSLKAADGKVNVEMKNAIEKIAKDLNLNIGNIPNDLNVKRIERGVSSFEKLNIKDEILKSLKNQKNLTTDFKSYLKNNPDVFELAGFKDTSGVGKNLTHITDRQIKGVENFFNQKGSKKFLDSFTKTFQNLDQRSVLQMARINGCLDKAAGGSVISCLQTKFNKAPEKFLQKSIPLVKKNKNLYKWFKTGRNIARGTGTFLAWEAALAPIIAGWGKLEGDSNQRILHDLFYGPIFEGVGVPPEYVPGKSAKEEWMEEAGGDELAYKMKRWGELEEQELPYLQQQRNDVINKMSNVPGTSAHQLFIEDDIKEKELELQGLKNTPEFYQGPAASYYNEPVINNAFDLEQQTTAKIAADTAERKKAAFDWLREKKLIANQNWQAQVPKAEGGIMNLKKKW